MNFQSINFIIYLIFLIVTTITSEDSRIVGGEKSPISYPYQISLQIKVRQYIAFIPIGNTKWTHNCGGAIITNKHIVSAAHCLVRYKSEGLSVLAGTNQLNKGGERFTVESFLTHPDYIELNNSDIGIITINAKFEFGDKIKPISYGSEHIGDGISCTLTGWGYTTTIRFGLPPNDLQRVNLPTISNDECNQKGMKVGPKEICTYSQFGQGACGGDSGGPIAKMMDDGNYLLVGVVSYGTRFCAIGKPDVYTRVSEFDSWITENSKNGI